jgi:hypothetical protein
MVIIAYASPIAAFRIKLDPVSFSIISYTVDKSDDAWEGWRLKIEEHEPY